MEKLHAVRSDPRFDLIVLDTPPTTNALDFLDAPQQLVGAIDSPVMRWFVEQMQAKSSIGLLGKGAAFVLRGLAKFTGVEFLEHVGEFVTDINELFGGFRERAKAVYEDLRGPDVAFVIVTSPSPLAVGEAMFFSQQADRVRHRSRARWSSTACTPPVGRTGATRCTRAGAAADRRRSIAARIARAHAATRHATKARSPRAIVKVCAALARAHRARAWPIPRCRRSTPTCTICAALAEVSSHLLGPIAT